MITRGNASLLALKIAAAAFLPLLLAACAPKPAAPDKLILQPIAFSDLPGWTNDRVTEAVPALQRSCATFSKQPSTKSLGIAGTLDTWKPACSALATARFADDAEARAFFEQWFAPYAVRNVTSGPFTGYYEDRLNGAVQQTGPYQTPLWQRPDDLVTVDLGAFKPEWKGQRIAGKVAAHKLEPYDDRAVVTRGSLTGRAQPLLWVDDPVDAFFLEIQGSGRVRLTDGNEWRIGYEAQNGQAYVPIGRVLADEGEVDKPVTMAKIRAWLKAHPQQAQAMMNHNPSVVFFRKIEGDGPLGAQGVALTPQRSLAVDPAFVPLGIPVWLDAENPAKQGPRLQRLVVAQDTGGAIKGAVRGDLFWGAGSEAEANAGMMQSAGTYYLLLPKAAHDDAGR